MAPPGRPPVRRSLERPLLRSLLHRGRRRRQQRAGHSETQKVEPPSHGSEPTDTSRPRISSPLRSLCDGGDVHGTLVRARGTRRGEDCHMFSTKWSMAIAGTLALTSVACGGGGDDNALPAPRATTTTA